MRNDTSGMLELIAKIQLILKDKNHSKKEVDKSLSVLFVSKSEKYGTYDYGIPYCFGGEFIDSELMVGMVVNYCISHFTSSSASSDLSSIIKMNLGSGAWSKGLVARLIFKAYEGAKSQNKKYEWIKSLVMNVCEKAFMSSAFYDAGFRGLGVEMLNLEYRKGTYGNPIMLELKGIRIDTEQSRVDCALVKADV
jgi:hypothetical protein